MRYLGIVTAGLLYCSAGCTLLIDSGAGFRCHGPDDCAEGYRCYLNECVRSEPNCGDFIVDLGEECDDGNSDDTDRCVGTCKLPFCGDGFVRAAVDLCDDGPADSGDCDHVDGISAQSCTFALCGDGYTNVAAGEACDDGNGDDSDRCPDGAGGTCAYAFCGDRLVWSTNGRAEVCDDGPADSGDCNFDGGIGPYACTLATCDDGYTNVPADAKCPERVPPPPAIELNATAQFVVQRELDQNFTATLDGAIDRDYFGAFRVTLRWTNPQVADLARIIVRKSLDGYPAGSGDGTSVYDGPPIEETTYWVAEDELGVPVFYAVYCADEVPNVSPAATLLYAPGSPRPQLRFTGVPHVDQTCVLSVPGEVTVTAPATLLRVAGVLQSVTTSDLSTASGFAVALDSIGSGSRWLAWQAEDSAHVRGAVTLAVDLGFGGRISHPLRKRGHSTFQSSCVPRLRWSRKVECPLFRPFSDLCRIWRRRGANWLKPPRGGTKSPRP